MYLAAVDEEGQAKLLLLMFRDPAFQKCISQDTVLTKTGKALCFSASIDLCCYKGDVEHARTSSAAVECFSACLNRKTLLIS